MKFIVFLNVLAVAYGFLAPQRFSNRFVLKSTSIPSEKAESHSSLLVCTSACIRQLIMIYIDIAIYSCYLSFDSCSLFLLRI